MWGPIFTETSRIISQACVHHQFITIHFHPNQWWCLWFWVGPSSSSLVWDNVLGLFILIQWTQKFWFARHGKFIVSSWQCKVTHRKTLQGSLRASGFTNNFEKTEGRWPSTYVWAHAVYKQKPPSWTTYAKIHYKLWTPLCCVKLNHYKIWSHITSERSINSWPART